MAETFQEWNQRMECSGCCPASLPPVPEPVCRSIEVEACGFELPEHPDVEPEEKCPLYRQKESKLDYEYHYSLDGYTDDEIRNESAIWKTLPNDHEDEGETEDCLLRNTFSSHTFNDHEKNVDPESGEVVGDFTYTETSGFTYPGTCSGTFTEMDNLTGIGGSGPYNICFTENFSPDVTWNYSGLTFSKTTTLDEENTTGFNTMSVIFSQPVTASVIQSDLDDLDWPNDDVEPEDYPEYIGTDCTAAIERKYCTYPEGEEPETPVDAASLARKAQVQWKIPSEHLGTGFQIDGDTLFLPEGYDEMTDTPTPTLTALPTIMWSGPGSGPADDPTWLTSRWDVANPSGQYGITKLVNVRFTHLPNNPLGPLVMMHPGFETYVAP